MDLDTTHFPVCLPYKTARLCPDVTASMAVCQYVCLFIFLPACLSVHLPTCPLARFFGTALVCEI